MNLQFRKTAGSAIALAVILTLGACSSDDSEPDESPGPTTSESQTSEPSESAEPESNVPDDLRKFNDDFVEDAIKHSPDVVDRISEMQKEADKVLTPEEQRIVGDTANPFTILENLPEDTNTKLYELYSDDNPMLKYFDLSGLEEHEKAAVAMWSQTIPLMFMPGTEGDPEVPDSSFNADGDVAVIDYSQATVTTPAGTGALVSGAEALQEVPLVKVDGEWLVDGATGYESLSEGI